MCYNCLLTRLWRHQIWNQPCLSYQAVLLYDQKVKTKKLKYLENKKGFWREIKSIFIIFKGLQADKNCLRHENALLKVILTCFPVTFAKILRTPFLFHSRERLLLSSVYNSKAKLTLILLISGLLFEQLLGRSQIGSQVSCFLCKRV